MLYGILASRSSKIAQVISQACHSPSGRGDDRGESIMRTAAFEFGSRESRGQVRMGSRSTALRKARLRALALESLEARTLLATLPSIIHDPNALLPLDFAKAGSSPTGGTTQAADNAT